MKSILVTGSNGQLGQCIRKIENQFGKANSFTYLSSSELDITEESGIIECVNTYKPDFIINCAAYTAVDKAEQEKEKAYLVNEKGVKNLAVICKKYQITLIHISTDFVFGDVMPIPLTEESVTNPYGVYGKSKLAGEERIRENLDHYFIIRTSWLYSEYQNNFTKTMLRLGRERDELSVVYDQVGTPTYAMDLAESILNVINSGSEKYGIYHYSNEGVASWYDFAYTIFKLANIKVNLKPITSDKYPIPAKRPSYSVMSKDKIKQNFNLEIKHWTISLAKCLENL